MAEKLQAADKKIRALEEVEKTPVFLGRMKK